MEPARRRGDEFKAKLGTIEQAESEADLVETYSTEAISFSEVTSLVIDRAKVLAEGKYGPNERQHLDLLFYFNYLDVRITSPIEVSSKCGEFRSVSVLTNTYCAVLAVTDGAPNFLEEGVFLNGQSVEADAI